MTYEQLYELKYKQGISTYELVCRYPNFIDRVSEVALMEVPEDTLSEVVQEKKVLKKLKTLKKRLLR